jgi:hypothetical protein
MALLPVATPGVICPYLMQQLELVFLLLLQFM